MQKVQDYHPLGVLVIIKKDYTEFFEKVNSKDVKDLVILVKKTAAVGWSTSLPLVKLIKEVTRDSPC